jgi:hypothetical protein
MNAAQLLLDELPTIASGKAQKNKLREQMTELLKG